MTIPHIHGWPNLMATMRLLGHYCIKWACHGCISATKSVTSMTHPHDDFNERKLARWYLHWKIKLFMLNCSISKKPLECCRTAIHCLLAPHFRKRKCHPSVGSLEGGPWLHVETSPSTRRSTPRAVKSHPAAQLPSAWQWRLRAKWFGGDPGSVGRSVHFEFWLMLGF